MQPGKLWGMRRLADACLEKFGGDSMAELQAHFEDSQRLARRWPR